MSIARLNCLNACGILPFNFGMDYEGWKKVYEIFGTDLCSSDPNTWSASQIEEVNRVAKEETELADRLLALSDEEFNKEVDRLREANRLRELAEQE